MNDSIIKGMREYVMQAVVLDREDAGEADSRVVLFTKKLGKIVAKATSARKITSKLSAHLEPGSLTTVRIAEKVAFQLTDALRSGRVVAQPGHLWHLAQLLPEEEPDLEVWELLLGKYFSWPRLLAVLGWDPTDARCVRCVAPPALFRPRDQAFFCSSCLPASHVGRHAIVLKG